MRSRMGNANTITDYLIEKLTEFNVRHLFGVPGDYALTLFSEFEKSPIHLINTVDEQGAGFAADAYARLNGLGAVAITYCVGGLKVANTTAQAYAEKSPVVVISGVPGIDEREKHPLLHHKVHDFDSQQKIFAEITVDTAVIDDPATACEEIDRVFNSALKFKRPVYIELPRNLTLAKIPDTQESNASTFTPAKSDPSVMEEFISEMIGMINAAHQPVIVAGVEVHRFGMQEQLQELARRTKIPVVSTLLGKSVINETHPGYIGMYDGAMGKEDVRNYVEDSDCLIFLGVFMSDINMGGFTAKLDQRNVISVTSEKISIRHHAFENLYFEDVIGEMVESDIVEREQKAIAGNQQKPTQIASTDRHVSVEHLFKRLNLFLDDDTAIIADPGDALFGAMDMTIHRQTEFLASAYYASLGFALPASLGVQLANSALRPLVLVGDGAFQMTGMELSTSVRFGLNPIVVVLNNNGYATERPMLDGSFNDILNWNYSEIPAVLNAGKGFDVRTEKELATALKEAKEYKEGFCLLNIHLKGDDSSPALQRLTKALKENI